MDPENLTYPVRLFEKMLDFWMVKLFLSGLLAGFGFLFNDGYASMLIGLFVLICMDTISALVACRKQCEEIKSSKFLRTAIKIAVYFTIVSAGHLTDQTLPVQFIEYAAIGFLSLTELVSIMENFGKAGYTMPKTLLNQIKHLRDRK